MCVDDVCDVTYWLFSERVCVMMCVTCSILLQSMCVLMMCVDDVCDVYYACYRACVC